MSEAFRVDVLETINGELSEKAHDRYVEIALALGTIDGPYVRGNSYEL